MRDTMTSSNSKTNNSELLVKSMALSDNHRNTIAISSHYAMAILSGYIMARQLLTCTALAPRETNSFRHSGAGIVVGMTG